MLWQDCPQEAWIADWSAGERDVGRSHILILKVLLKCVRVKMKVDEAVK